MYHAVTDTFGLKEDNEETRSTKIQQIFKNRNKKMNVPDIKITHSQHTYTNKFLSKIIGKSSSVDNLSSETGSNNDRTGNIFEDADLKTKSLSSNEIFLATSPMVSRCGSVSRLNRKPLQTLSINYNAAKPASYHGSYENLERKLELTVPESTNSLSHMFAGEQSCYCPFENSCAMKIRGKFSYKCVRVLEDFKSTHSFVFNKRLCAFK